MSVGHYKLWCPWRESGLLLAACSSTYEPGQSTGSSADALGHKRASTRSASTTHINRARMHDPAWQLHPPNGYLNLARRNRLCTLHEPWTNGALHPGRVGCCARGVRVTHSQSLKQPALLGKPAEKDLRLGRQELGFSEAGSERFRRSTGHAALGLAGWGSNGRRRSVAG